MQNYSGHDPPPDIYHDYADERTELLETIREIVTTEVDRKLTVTGRDSPLESTLPFYIRLWKRFQSIFIT